MPSNRFRALARWALIAAALAMGGALLATVWSTHQTVEEASATLVRGHADVFHDALRAQFNNLPGPATGADLRTMLDGHSADGLRYVAVIDRDGAITAEAGEPITARTALERAVGQATPSLPIDIAGRIRVVYRGPPRAALARRPQHVQRSRAFVIEFEPQITRQLRAASRRALGIGALAAGSLLIVALGLVRWFWRREALERQMQHERRLASLGEMSAVLAHEIRNPLASLKGNAQLLERALDLDAAAAADDRREQAREKTRDKARRVVAEALRLETLTNNLLEFVRAGEIRREPVDPAELLRAAAGSVAPDRIKIEVAGAPATWQMDGERVRQVLNNLLENAIQAGEGDVTASAAMVRGRLVFTVRDHGGGIPAEAMPRLFEPFFTLRTRGTGLGLAVAKRIIDLHEGTITAANADDGGAVFAVELPR